jgi:hypothetical protein
MKEKKQLTRIIRRIRRNRRAFALRTALVLLGLCVLLILMRCGRKMDREYTGQDTTEESYGVFLGVDATTFSMDLFEGYDMVVVDAQELRSDQLAQLHATGHTVYSYLNVGSIEESRSYFDDYSDCCLDRYENWPEEFWVDVTRPEWQKLVTEELTDRILDADPQIDGLFLDNLDISVLAILDILPPDNLDMSHLGTSDNPDMLDIPHILCTVHILGKLDIPDIFDILLFCRIHVLSCHIRNVFYNLNNLTFFYVFYVFRNRHIFCKNHILYPLPRLGIPDTFHILGIVQVLILFLSRRPRPLGRCLRHLFFYSLCFLVHILRSQSKYYCCLKHYDLRLF